MKKIIAATDFSAAATNAVHYAADMAMNTNAELLLLYIFQPPISYTEMAIPIDIDGMKRTAESEMNRYRENLTERTKSKLSISTEVRMGAFFTELKTVCDQLKPYTVVMGSQGSTAAERFFFGGHTVHAMRQLEWPLITVPPGVQFSPIRHIALACDFENVTGTIPVDEIRILVNDFNAKLHVINTSKKDEYNPEIVFGSTMLTSMLAPIEAEYHFLSDANIDESIIQFAGKNNIDLLVVLPKRHDIIESITHKSHTKQMVLHSHIPVMALHGNA